MQQRGGDTDGDDRLRIGPIGEPWRGTAGRREHCLHAGDAFNLAGGCSRSWTRCPAPAEAGPQDRGQVGAPVSQPHAHVDGPRLLMHLRGGHLRRRRQPAGQRGRDDTGANRPCGSTHDGAPTAPGMGPSTAVPARADRPAHVGRRPRPRERVGAVRGGPSPGGDPLAQRRQRSHGGPTLPPDVGCRLTTNRDRRWAGRAGHVTDPRRDGSTRLTHGKQGGDQGRRGSGRRKRSQTCTQQQLRLEVGAAVRAARHVSQGPVADVVRQRAVGQRTDSGRQALRPMSALDHASPPASSGARAARGRRCASAARSCERPRWMRDRTVPSLIPSVAETSS
jgi:hypothetical protein